jgi:hypothetical protein
LHRLEPDPVLKQLLCNILVWGFFWIALVKPAFAQEETSVLPHGVFRAWFIGAVGGTEYKFNSSGKRQNLAHELNRSISMTDLENALANSPSAESRKTSAELQLLRTELNTFGAGVGSPALGNNLYQSDFYADAQVEASQLIIALEYGLTPKLSLGLAVPLVWYDIKARVAVRNQDSFAQTLDMVKGTPLETNVRRFASEAPTLETYKNSIFTENGYQVPGNNRIFGVSDLEGGFKYRALESRYVDTALLFGFRLPTGTYKKDPSNLVDQSVGDGQLDLALQVSIDFKITPQLVFLSSAKYTFQTPDRENIVGPLIGSTNPLPNLKNPNVYDNANRKLGNIWDLNFNLRYYMFQRRFAIIGAYLYHHKYSDSYSGTNQMLNYSALERNTNSQYHAAQLFLVYSTVSDFMRGEKAIPWEAGITYHHTLAGINSLDTRYAYARLKFFFN